MSGQLLSLEDFRRLRDWYGLKDIASRLPALEERLKTAQWTRATLKRQVAYHTARKQRVPRHLEDEYNAASWAWQDAYGALTLARQEYHRLLTQHPEWNEEVNRQAADRT